MTGAVYIYTFTRIDNSLSLEYVCHTLEAIEKYFNELSG